MNKYLKLKNYVVKFNSIFGKKYSISYAQGGEDIILWNLCKALGIQKPTYIDIGAFHPKILSNTYLFYKNGSRGITIEPNKKIINEFKKVRPKDRNLSIAISSNIGKSTYYVMDTPTLNTLSLDEVKTYEKLGHIIVDSYEVETTTLDEIIKKYSNNVYPDILSIDTEGYDMEILKTINFQRGKPKIICAETSEHSSKYEHKKDVELISYIENMGYVVYADTYVNTIFVQNNIEYNDNN